MELFLFYGNLRLTGQFGGKETHIQSVPKCPLDSSAQKCMRHFGPRIKRCFDCCHCVKKCRPTLYSL